MNYLELLRLASPEAQVLGTALVVLTIGLTKWRTPAILTLLAAIGLALSVAATLRLPADTVLLGGMLVITPLTSLFKIVCLVLAFFTVLLAHGDRGLRPHYAEFLALLLLASVGLMLLVGSEELLMIFIGLELTGLSLYVLTGFNKADRNSAEAALKYFLFGSTASAFTLFGLSLIYGLTGATALRVIAQSLMAAPASPLLALGVVMTLIGFAFKIAAAPFHLWAPDTYQAAPISSAAFIAAGSKVASFVVLGKILLVGFAPVTGHAGWHALAAGWAPVVAALAALSILIGNFAALAQRNVRRLLAYSAVAHAGYALLGLLAGREGFSATLFYTTVYALTLIGAFGVIGFVRRTTGGDDLAHFAGLRQRAPLLAGAMAVFMLSLAGLPPLAGFFGKFYLFVAAFRTGNDYGLLWLVALALFGSLISLYYYLMVLRTIFLDEPKFTPPLSPPPGRLTQVVPASLAAGILLLGALPNVLLQRILAALP